MLQDPFNTRSSWSELERLRREMNRLFDRPGRAVSNVASDYPAMNVWTNNDNALVTAELPGIDTEELDISVRENTLSIKGNRKATELQEGETFHRRERGYGKFQRMVQLPFSVDASKVEATYENGVLRITLPRAEADKPRRISVTSA